MFHYHFADRQQDSKRNMGAIQRQVVKSDSLTLENIKSLYIKMLPGATRNARESSHGDFKKKNLFIEGL
jgi:hypothetical protein